MWGRKDVLLLSLQVWRGKKLPSGHITTSPSLKEEGKDGDLPVPPEPSAGPKKSLPGSTEPGRVWASRSG